MLRTTTLIFTSLSLFACEPLVDTPDDSEPVSCSQEWATETVAEVDLFHLDDAGVNYIGDEPMLAVGPSGQAHVVWIDRADNVLRHATRTSDGWDIEDVVSVDPTDISANTGLLVDGEGAAHVAYFERNTGLHYATDTDGDWEVTSISNEHLLTFYQGYRVAMQFDPAGTPRMFWAGGRSDRALWSAVPDQSPERLFDGGEVNALSLHHHSVTYDSSGRLHLAFFGLGFDTVYATLKGSEKSWTVLDDGIDIGLFASVALDSEGRPHVTYPRGGTYHLMMDPEWSAPGSEPVLDFNGFSMVAGPTGRLHLAGNDGDGLVMATWIDGQWVSESVGFDGPATFTTAAAGHSALHVLWYDSTHRRLQYGQRCEVRD